MKPRQTLIWAADLRAARVFHHCSVFLTFLSYGLLIGGAWNQSRALLAWGLLPMVAGLACCSLYIRFRRAVLGALRASILAGENSILS